jgi:hypothetical protein
MSRYGAAQPGEERLLTRYGAAQPREEWLHGTIARTDLREALGGGRQRTCGPTFLTGNGMGSEVPCNDLHKGVLRAEGFRTEIDENLQCPQSRCDVVAGGHANDCIDQIGGSWCRQLSDRAYRMPRLGRAGITKQLA